MCTIYWRNQNHTQTVAAGTMLSQAMVEAGYMTQLPCGGQGTCGKCKVTLVEGDDQREVLACQTPVTKDLTVLTQGVNETTTATIMTQGMVGQPFTLNPSVSKQWVRKGALTAPHCGSYVEQGTLQALRDVSQFLHHGGKEGCTLVHHNHVLVGVEAGDTTDKLYGGAIDIGTTTVVLYGYNLTTGELVSTQSAWNGQQRFGADVISRISHGIDSQEQLSSLTAAIVETINGLLAQVEQEVPDFCKHLYHLVVCGNSTMEQLLLGFNPIGLAGEPFANITASGMTVKGSDLSLTMHPCGVVDILPLLGGFVGGDTTSVLLTLPEEDKPVLMVDLGTNGEIALKANGVYKVASTACGPALEGGNISCGMRGTTGAISACTVEGEQLVCSVIGGGEAKGICGSAIVDIVALLCQQGVIDEMGYMEPASESSQGLGKLVETVDVSTRRFPLAKDVYMSQQDVRQIQLAKSAICAGCLALLDACDVALSDLHRLYIAGAFGNYINIASALEIGLLPPVPTEKIVPIGNGAGSGVQLCLLDRDHLARSKDLPKTTEHLELASSAYFMEQYIANMNFMED